MSNSQQEIYIQQGSKRNSLQSINSQQQIQQQKSEQETMSLNQFKVPVDFNSLNTNLRGLSKSLSQVSNLQYQHYLRQQEEKLIKQDKIKQILQKQNEIIQTLVLDLKARRNQRLTDFLIDDEEKIKELEFNQMEKYSLSQKYNDVEDILDQEMQRQNYAMYQQQMNMYQYMYPYYQMAAQNPYYMKQMQKLGQKRQKSLRKKQQL